MERKEVTVKFSKNLEWLAPYVQIAAKMHLPIDKLDSVKGYHVPEGKIERNFAKITVRRGRYSIQMLDKYQSYEKPGKLRGYTSIETGFRFEDTLRTLAHELAHMAHWDHNADRLILEAKLYLAFAKYAKKSNYLGY